jgi:integrase
VAKRVATCGLILIAAGKSKAARRQLPIAPQVFSALKARHLAQGKPESGWVFPAMLDNVKQWSAKNQHAKATRFLTKISEAHELWKKNGGKGNWAKQLAGATSLKRAFIERHADAIRSGVKRFEPYCLRHTALTRLAEAGCDTFTLAKFAGHSRTPNQFPRVALRG